MSRVLPAVAAVVILAALAWSVYVAPASATVIAGPDPALVGWARGVAALSAEPLPTGTVTVTLDRSLMVAGYRANGSFAAGSVVLAGRDDFALMHELGHAYDERDLDGGERAHLLGALGYDQATPWRNPRRWAVDPFCSWIACPNEVFANAYAGCALGYVLLYRDGAPVPRHYGRAVAWWISPHAIVTRAELWSICRYIAQAGA